MPKKSTSQIKCQEVPLKKSKIEIKCQILPKRAAKLAEHSIVPSKLQIEEDLVLNPVAFPLSFLEEMSSVLARSPVVSCPADMTPSM